MFYFPDVPVTHDLELDAVIRYIFLHKHFVQYDLSEEFPRPQLLVVALIDERNRDIDRAVCHTQTV